MNRALDETQELACAKVYTDFIEPTRGLHRLERAREALGGRWDFVARPASHNPWIAIEIKRLLVVESKKQFNDWQRFFDGLSSSLPLSVKGEHYVSIAVPWQFRQKQVKSLRAGVIGALVSLQLQPGQSGNLGPEIASRFAGWPTKPPTNDQELWQRRGVWKIIHPPEDLRVWNTGGDATTVKVGISTGPLAFDVPWQLTETLLDIFEPDESGRVKPNMQLADAKAAGASETVLLLDCKFPWRPATIRSAMQWVHKESLSHIDRIYAIRVTEAQTYPIHP